MSRFATSARPWALLALVLLLLSGCDLEQRHGYGRLATPDLPYSGMSATDIYTLARQTSLEAESVQIRVQGEDAGGATELNLAVDRTGRARGSWRQGEYAMKLLFARGGLYYRPNAEYLHWMARGDDAWAEEMTGRWVKADRDRELQEIFQLVDFHRLLDEVLGETPPADEVRRVKGRTFDGERSVGLRREDWPGSLHVAADESGRPLAVLRPDVKIRFVAWDRKVRARPPARLIPEEDLSWSEEPGLRT